MSTRTPLESALLDAPANPFDDPVVRLDAGLAPPPDVESLHAGVRSELARAIASVGQSHRAAMVLVHGEPGQGKTHELARLRAGAHDFHFLEVPPLKDAGAPFQHVLRYVAQGLIAQGALARYLWETLQRAAEAVRDQARAEGDEPLALRLDGVLVGGPRFLGSFQAMLAQERDLLDVIARRGRTLPPMVALDPDFARVLGRVADRDAEAPVLDWIRGAELPDEDLHLLGVARNLDGEARCFEILRSLAAIAARPLALCFDQLESTSGLLGMAGVEALFTALMEIYQQLPVCVVLMCQTQVWAELQRTMPQAARDRIRELPKLGRPRPEDAIRLVAAHLEPVWQRAGVAPPYASYPFSADYLHGYVEEIAPSVRQVLLNCGSLLQAMRTRGSISEVEGATPVPVTDGPALGPSDVVALELRKLTESLAERADLGTPALRQDRLRSALTEILTAAADKGRPLAGVRLLSVEAPPKPRSGPRPPMTIAIELPGLPGSAACEPAARATGVPRRLKLALEVQSDDPRGAYRVLERLQNQLQTGDADRAVLLREADAPVGASAKRTLELARALEPHGGLVYLEKDLALRLVAAELLLDAVSAAEVWVGNRAATRAEVLGYLLEQPEIERALAPILSRLAAPLPEPTPAENDLPDRVLALLRHTWPVMSAQTIAGALGIDAAALEPVIAQLEQQGKVNIVLDRDYVFTVLLAPRQSK